MKGNTLNVMFFILKNKLLKNGEAPVVLRVTIIGGVMGQCKDA